MRFYKFYNRLFDSRYETVCIFLCYSLINNFNCNSIEYSNSKCTIRYGTLINNNNILSELCET